MKGRSKFSKNVTKSAAVGNGSSIGSDHSDQSSFLEYIQFSWISNISQEKALRSNLDN